MFKDNILLLLGKLLDQDYIKTSTSFPLTCTFSTSLKFLIWDLKEFMGSLLMREVEISITICGVHKHIINRSCTFISLKTLKKNLSNSESQSKY